MAFDPNAVRSGALASTNPTYLGAWICYINGRYVPVMGFDTDASVWGVPTFRVHLLPDPVMTRFGAEDRVQVVLFYLDHWYDAAKPELRMLIDGEVVGWSFSSSAGSRSIALTCAGHLSVFQALYFHYMTNVDDIVASRAPEVQATSVATTPGPIYPYGLFHQGLTPTAAQLAAESPGSTAATAPGVEGAPTPSTPIQSAYELVTNVIRGCISKEVPDARRAVPAMNFFGRWVRLTSFHNRWVRLPLLEDPDKLASRVGVFPIFNAVRNAEALTAMQRHVASQVGNAGNLWNLFQQVLGLVYMEIGTVTNPCTVLVQLNDTTGGAGSNPVDGRIIGHPTYGTRQVDQRSAEARAAGTMAASPGISPLTPVRLAQHFVKPQMIMGEVPACNAIFPSMIEAWGFDENYAAQPTRTYINDSVMTQALRAEGPNREFMLHALMAGYPEEAMALLRHRAGAADGAASGPIESGKNLLVWPEEYYKGIVTARAALPAWFQMLRQFANAQAATPQAPGASAGEAPEQVARPVNTTPDASVVASLGAVAPITLPARPDGGRRGRTPPNAPRPEEQASYPYRWIAPEETLTKGRAQNTPYTSVRRVATVRNVRTEQATDDVAPYPGTKALRDFLYRRFPEVFSRTLGPNGVNRTIGLERPRDRRTPIAIGRNIDDHRAGMALDLTIPPVHGHPNLEVGAPIANWLVENAQALGIAYLVYGRSIWAGSDSFGRRAGSSAGRFRHYTVPGAAMDHFDHIHVTMVRDVALGYGGILGRNNPLPALNTSTLTAVRRPVALPTGAPGTGTQTTPTPTASAGGAPATAAEGDSFAALFELYAQYEHLRARYAQRTASAQLAFNPYLVTGFPAMLFDSMATGMHVVGYAQRVSHVGMVSGGGARLATTVQFAFCRTFYEFLADVKADAQRFAGRVTSAPADLVRELREVTQDEAQAEVFYGRLLYGGRSLDPFTISRPTAGTGVGVRRAVLRWSDVLGYASAGGRTEEIVLQGESVATIAAQERAAEQGQAPAGGVAERVGVEGIDLDRELSPRENGYAEAFVSYDVAMQYAARPCCTLDEYVRFWHGGKSIPELQRIGQVGAVRTDFAYASENVPDVLKTVPNGRGGTDFVEGERRRETAGFYERIYKLRPGPGPEPTPAQRGYTSDPLAPVAAVEGLPPDYPQTRTDWDRALDYYVEKVLNRVTPSR